MSGRVCLVTGVGPGTGAAVARRFAADGYTVAARARSAERLEALAEEVFRLAHQPRSAWSFESVIRPFGEAW